MSSNSSIEWTEATWNPVTGCTHVSSGCTNCYAERMAKRLKAMGVHKYRNVFQVTCHEKCLLEPYSWSKPTMVFVNSMGDLFHEDVPDRFIAKVFETMKNTPQHIYQILTKRADRLATLSGHLSWMPNIWMGVTVENAVYQSRINLLRTVPAAVRFLSLEPLLGPLPNLNLADIDWVIVGGESGPGARPMEASWVTHIRDQCVETKTPFFFKQWGGLNKKKAGRLLEGRAWQDMPHWSDS